MLFSGVFIRDIEDSNPLLFVVTIELLKQFKNFLAKGKRKKNYVFNELDFLLSYFIIIIFFKLISEVTFDFFFLFLRRAFLVEV